MGERCGLRLNAGGPTATCPVPGKLPRGFAVIPSEPLLAYHCRLRLAMGGQAGKPRGSQARAAGSRGASSRPFGGGRVFDCSGRMSLGHRFRDGAWGAATNLGRPGNRAAECGKATCVPRGGPRRARKPFAAPIEAGCEGWNGFAAGWQRLQHSSGFFGLRRRHALQHNI